MQVPNIIEIWKLSQVLLQGGSHRDDAEERLHSLRTARSTGQIQARAAIHGDSRSCFGQGVNTIADSKEIETKVIY